MNHSLTETDQKSSFIPKLPRYLLAPALEVIQKLIDSHIADRQDEEVEANLYSARLHITKAIEEVEKAKKVAA